ncbi:hypothetical protein M0804_008031 [Polistes exclamans]|nr:hypothetical protein M0804_008031 [Polistes exclamans]
MEQKKTVVGEVARHSRGTVSGAGRGPFNRLGGPTASVVFRRASSQHYEHYFDPPPAGIIVLRRPRRRPRRRLRRRRPREHFRSPE